MICGKCGKKNKEDALFCAKCNAFLTYRSNDEEEIFCNNCGKMNDAGSVYCSNCKAYLNKDPNKVSDEVKKKIEEQRTRIQAEKKREEATKNLKDAVSINGGIKENPVAANAKKTAKVFEKWADRVYKWITVPAIIESIIAIILGFIMMFDSGFGTFAILLGSAVVWLFLNFINAMFIRFVLNCVAQNYYAQAEMVQNTHISANVALYSTIQTEE